MSRGHQHFSAEQTATNGGSGRSVRGARTHLPRFPGATERSRAMVWQRVRIVAFDVPETGSGATHCRPPHPFGRDVLRGAPPRAVPNRWVMEPAIDKRGGDANHPSIAPAVAGHSFLPRRAPGRFFSGGGARLGAEGRLRGRTALRSSITGRTVNSLRLAFRASRGGWVVNAPPLLAHPLRGRACGRYATTSGTPFAPTPPSDGHRGARTGPALLPDGEPANGEGLMLWDRTAPWQARGPSGRATLGPHTRMAVWTAAVRRAEVQADGRDGGRGDRGTLRARPSDARGRRRYDDPRGQRLQRQRRFPRIFRGGAVVERRCGRVCARAAVRIALDGGRRDGLLGGCHCVAVGRVGCGGLQLGCGLQLDCSFGPAIAAAIWTRAACCRVRSARYCVPPAGRPRRAPLCTERARILHVCASQRQRAAVHARPRVGAARSFDTRPAPFLRRSVTVGGAGGTTGTGVRAPAGRCRAAAAATGTPAPRSCVGPPRFRRAKTRTAVRAPVARCMRSFPSISHGTSSGSSAAAATCPCPGDSPVGHTGAQSSPATRSRWPDSHRWRTHRWRGLSRRTGRRSTTTVDRARDAARPGRSVRGVLVAGPKLVAACNVKDGVATARTLDDVLGRRGGASGAGVHTHAPRSGAARSGAYPARRTDRGRFTDGTDC